METYSFGHALLPEGWSGPTEFDVAESTIQSIRVLDSDSLINTSAHHLAVPGMANVHSHAFQYAFAGLSEYRTASHDSFWTWRQQMYRFLETLTPDDVFEIGKRLYATMRLAGYTTVGEFHYLHHQPNGQPYHNMNAMSDALIQAALDVGMKICMLPVLYQRGGFDDRPLEGGQRRFGCDPDQYLSMLEKLSNDWITHDSIRIGIALHSLRAVPLESAQRVIQDATQLLGDCPIHIHVAEQTQEVDDCLRATGRRPVELLLESFDVGPRWCLIHATHMTPLECEAVATSGAVIGVCPTTEANLGDGVFLAEDYLQASGRLAIGSDSHISLDPCEELRLLEYGQRLVKQRRAVLCTQEKSCGNLLYGWAAEGGAVALGFGLGKLEPHQPSLIGLLESPRLDQIPLERVLDYAIFHASPTARLLSAL